MGSRTVLDSLEREREKGFMVQTVTWSLKTAFNLRRQQADKLMAIIKQDY
jgi:hypothetical protein